VAHLPAESAITIDQRDKNGEHSSLHTYRNAFSMSAPTVDTAFWDIACDATDSSIVPVFGVALEVTDPEVS
jgi:hypothetical protein